MTLADERGMRPRAAHCPLGLGTLYAKGEASRASPRRDLYCHDANCAYGYDVLALPGRGGVGAVRWLLRSVDLCLPLTLVV